MTSIRRLTAGVHGADFAIGEQFEHLRKDLRAVVAVQGERELGDQEAVGRAEVVAAAVVFEREVLLVAGEFGQRGGEGGGAVAEERP